MLLRITLATVLLSTGILALPSTLYSRADENCVPTSYAISDYSLDISPTSAHVQFSIHSRFRNPDGIVDSLLSGATCNISGPTLPNNNECRVQDRKLLLDLRAPQEQGYYQLTHTWLCNGATWMSGTPVKMEPLECIENGASRACSSGLQEFTPGNVRKICNSPRC